MYTKFDTKQLLNAIPLFVMLILLSCGTKGVKNDRNGSSDISNRRENGAAGNNDRSLDKKYIAEGFISDELYRVVIVSTREECEGGDQEIGEKSRKRALVSLEKYISSQDRKVDGNSRSMILDLLSRHGTFTRKDDRCGEKNIYYYEIRKNDLRGYVNGISRR